LGLDIYTNYIHLKIFIFTTSLKQNSIMILIADSGSTNTVWKLIRNSGETTATRTSGINPFFRTSEDIFQELSNLLLPETGANIQEIYFYGAGIINAEKGEVIRKALLKIYPEAHIETYSDVLAAARALFGDQPGIAGILGTGSNVCLYDGQKISGGISPLGFILGDEGSGAVMGRKLVGDYFKEVMPGYLRDAFSEKFHLNRDEVLNRVYRTEKPNQYLAQFVPFLSDHAHSAYCQEFVQQNFMEYFERNVVKLPDYRRYSIGFVGSVAYHFSQILINTASYYGFEHIKILKEPIEGLGEYYIRKK
jgi:N-acetylglucosamine kinase-like BadF-type ATPase